MVKSSVIIQQLVERGLIPSFGEFTITEALIDSYQEIYKALYEKTGTGLKGSNKKYARKLAGIFLIKENQKRLSSIEKTAKIKSKYKQDCGIIYLISNPAFPNCYKIGITKNLESRIKAYQTYDPHKAFKVEHYKFVKNARSAEKDILTTFGISLLKGEWVEGTEVKKYFIDAIQNM